MRHATRVTLPLPLLFAYRVAPPSNRGSGLATFLAECTVSTEYTRRQSNSVTTHEAAYTLLRNTIPQIRSLGTAVHVSCARASA